MDLNNIKLIISEIDGVVTDGKALTGEMNIVIAKNYNIIDFEAINLLKKDFAFVFMSSRCDINISMCKKRNIPFFFAERSKKETLTHILGRYNLTPDDVMYVGSGLSDLDVMRSVYASVCPSNAPVKLLSLHNLFAANRLSGDGVLTGLYEIIQDYKLIEGRNN